LPPTFSSAWSTAWSGLKMKSPERKVRARFTDDDWKALKDAYHEQHGNIITIPNWDDIIKWKPTLLKTADEIKTEKKRALDRILASPATDFQRSYSSVMTYIDNIQDTSSIVYPAFRMLTRWAPSVFGRMIPGMGWILLGYDLLNLANALLRSPLTPMKAKRAACFSKMAKASRVTRVKNWNPRFSDVIQAAQVTADYTGVGLTLGGVMGFFQDLVSGAVRAASGEKVRFAMEPPKFNLHELKATQAMRAAAWINSSGQTFEEDMHFYTMATFAASTALLTPLIETYDLSLNLINPQDALLDAPEPEDPITREVIQQAGLSIDAGVRFPIIGDKRATWLDVSNAQLDASRMGTIDFYWRHQRDSMGFVAARLMDDASLDMIDAMEPDAQPVIDDTPETHLFFTLIKTPICPDPPLSPDQAVMLTTWAKDFNQLNERYAGPRDIKEKLGAMGVNFRSEYPAAMDPTVEHLWPPNPDFSEFD